MSHVKHHAIIVTGDIESVEEAIDISFSFLSDSESMCNSQLCTSRNSLNTFMIASDSEKNLDESCKDMQPIFDLLNESKGLNVCWVYYGGDDRSEGFVDDPMEGILK